MASSATYPDATSLGTLGSGLRALEQQQQALLSSVKILKQKLESRPSSAAPQVAPSSVAQSSPPLSPTSSRISSATSSVAFSKPVPTQLFGATSDSDELSNDRSISDTSVSAASSELHIPFELVKKGYEIVETFFVGEAASVRTLAQSNNASNVAVDVPLGHRSINVLGVNTVAKQSFTAPSIAGASSTLSTSRSSNDRNNEEETSREPKFIHAVNPLGQHVFIVLDVNGIVSAAPCDPTIFASSSKTVAPDLLEECDEYVRAANSSVVAVHSDHLCVYSKELDNQFRRQIFSRGKSGSSALSGSLQEDRSNESLRELNSPNTSLRSGSFLDSDKFVKHYPIVRCSTIFTDASKALELCDTCIKALVQCSIRLSSKKMLALRSNVRLLLANIDRYDSASQRFLNVTRKSLGFLQSVHDGIDSDDERIGTSSSRHRSKVRFNIQKRLEYVTDFSETRNCFFNEAMQTVAYLNGAIEHLTSGTSEKSDRMQYILEPAKPNAQCFSSSESLLSKQCPDSSPSTEISGSNTRDLNKRGVSLSRRTESSKKTSNVAMDDNEDDDADDAQDANLARLLASALAASSPVSQTSGSSLQRQAPNVPKSMRKFVSARKLPPQ